MKPYSSLLGCRPHFPHSHSLPSIFILLTVALLVFASGVHAQSWYIKPSAEIPIRRGQGTEYRIVVVLKQGTAVTLLKDTPPWARIRTKNGTEGWMLKRYLSAQPPLDMIVEDLRERNIALQEQEDILNQKLSMATTTNAEMKSELQSCMTALDTTKRQYGNLKEEAANVITIRENLTKSEQQVTELSNQVKVIVEENERLKRSHQTKWFLAGAGTLVFGWLAGLLSAKSKKRRSSLY